MQLGETFWSTVLGAVVALAGSALTVWHQSKEVHRTSQAGHLERLAATLGEMMGEELAQIRLATCGDDLPSPNRIRTLELLVELYFDRLAGPTADFLRDWESFLRGAREAAPGLEVENQVRAGIQASIGYIHHEPQHLQALIKPDLEVSVLKSADALYRAVRAESRALAKQPSLYARFIGET